RAADCLESLRGILSSRSTSLDDARVHYTWALSSVGPYLTIEAMFYWDDALTPLHDRYLSERNRERFGGRVSAPATRALIHSIRRDLRDEMDRHGAVHAQLGRLFHYTQAMD